MNSMEEAFSRNHLHYGETLTVLFRLLYNQHSCYGTSAVDSTVYIHKPILRIELSSPFSQGNGGTNFVQIVYVGPLRNKE